jgi:hypothetical protein
VALITFDMQEEFGEQAVGGGYARKVAGFRQGMLKVGS